MTTVAPARSESTGDSLTAARSSLANAFFSRLTAGAASLILITLAAVATFLVMRAWPAITSSSADLASKVDWLGTASSDTLIATIGYLVFGTLLIGTMALLIGAPISFGIALFISHYAPRRLAATLGYIVDLLAAVPSVVYGLWGGFVLVPKLAPFYGWLNREFGWFPLFSGEVSPTGRVALSASIVLAIMILPIITAVTREVFLQTPILHEEAALAMGATRWEMIRMAVFPFARSGMIGATMLGLGRALGETMAVYMILSPGLSYSFHILDASKHNTIAANIALKFPEANATGVEALIAMGLALFVITLGVNVLARWIVSRRSEFSGAN
ncbi:MAG TPA: phosphate ABC transporter permease subunit PstC [Demequinaceae bacterium]